MKSTLIALAVTLTGLSTWANTNCPSDAALTKAGFDVSTEGFVQAAAKVNEVLTSQQDYLEALKGGTVHSSVSGKMVTVVPVDDLRSPRTEMIGDYVVMHDFKTGVTSEVRWYENGVKYVRYNTSETPCAMDMVPWAYNSLY